MRLDVYLSQKQYFTSREKSMIAIKKGIVMVNGKVILKPSFIVSDSDKIEVTSELLKYVSFGGLKLERAIDVFNLDFNNKVILDIGASTGGFTDCSLQHGASLVYAVDVGTNQLADKLLNDSRVKVFENTNIRDFNCGERFDYLVMDVSFVSITKIIPYLLKFMDKDNQLICLVKPQFEVGNIKLKQGVVKDLAIHKKVLKEMIEFINNLGLYVNNLTYSTQKGKKGNIEFLLLVSKKDNQCKYNIDKIVELSHLM